MAGKFSIRKFSEINLDDSFFDTLKRDYPGNENSTGFVEWFCRKAESGFDALVFDDEQGIGAFICLKKETESIYLQNTVLPQIPRLKISTLRLAERYRGQRLGEGAIGLILWQWQASKLEEVYVTVFGKHDTLILQLEKYGFNLVGLNRNGENVYVKSRAHLDYSSPYKSFPFISPYIKKAGYLIVEDVYHDTLFPYSELKNTLQTQIALHAANGLCKIYVGAASHKPHYQKGEPILIYRKYTGPSGKRYKSCVTSYCVVNDVIVAKQYGRILMSFDELLRRIGNKSVFEKSELAQKYNGDNLIIIEMLYYGYFGEGNNINMDWLDRNGYWAKQNQYPTDVQLNLAQFREILGEGNIDVSNVIID